MEMKKEPVLQEEKWNWNQEIKFRFTWYLKNFKPLPRGSD